MNLHCTKNVFQKPGIACNELVDVDKVRHLLCMPDLHVK
jgi:hypothetical protein